MMPLAHLAAMSRRTSQEAWSFSALVRTVDKGRYSIAKFGVKAVKSGT